MLGLRRGDIFCAEHRFEQGIAVFQLFSKSYNACKMLSLVMRISLGLDLGIEGL